MSVCAIIPVLASHASWLTPLIDSLWRNHIPYVLVITGCNDHNTRECVAIEAACFHGALNIIRQQSPCPYKARNTAINYAKQYYYTSYLLLDADSRPQDGFYEALSSLSAVDALVVGRVTTEVPGCSPHFNMLGGIEVYEGFGPRLPDGSRPCIGACMLVGSEVWDDVGPFVEARSGGDAALSFAAYEKGTKTAEVPALHVAKCIYSHTLRGICTKQVARGYGLHKDALPDQGTVLQGIRSSAAGIVTALESGTTDHYRDFVQHLMSLLDDVGKLARHVD